MASADIFCSNEIPRQCATYERVHLYVFGIVKWRFFKWKNVIALQSTKNFQTLEESRFEFDADCGCSRFVKSSIVVFATRVLVWFLRNVQYAKHGFKSLEICLLYFYLRHKSKTKRGKGFILNNANLILYFLNWWWWFVTSLIYKAFKRYEQYILYILFWIQLSSNWKSVIRFE